MVALRPCPSLARAILLACVSVALLTGTLASPAEGSDRSESLRNDSLASASKGGAAYPLRECSMCMATHVNLTDKEKTRVCTSSCRTETLAWATKHAGKAMFAGAPFAAGGAALMNKEHRTWDDRAHGQPDEERRRDMAVHQALVVVSIVSSVAVIAALTVSLTTVYLWAANRVLPRTTDAVAEDPFPADLKANLLAQRDHVV